MMNALESYIAAAGLDEAVCADELRDAGHTTRTGIFEIADIAEAEREACIGHLRTHHARLLHESEFERSQRQ